MVNVPPTLTRTGELGSFQDLRLARVPAGITKVTSLGIKEPEAGFVVEGTVGDTPGVAGLGVVLTAPVKATLVMPQPYSEGMSSTAPFQVPIKARGSSGVVPAEGVPAVEGVSVDGVLLAKSSVAVDAVAGGAEAVPEPSAAAGVEPLVSGVPVEGAADLPPPLAKSCPGLLARGFTVIFSCVLARPPKQPANCIAREIANKELV